MSAARIEHHSTVWMVDEIPTRMVYAGKRWRVTDTPTRLRPSSWPAPHGVANADLYGWRFQGTDDDGLSLVFDVYRTDDDWHVHRAYD